MTSSMHITGYTKLKESCRKLLDTIKNGLKHDWRLSSARRPLTKHHDLILFYTLILLKLSRCRTLLLLLLVSAEKVEPSWHPPSCLWQIMEKELWVFSWHCAFWKSSQFTGLQNLSCGVASAIKSELILLNQPNLWLSSAWPLNHTQALLMLKMLRRSPEITLKKEIK